MTPGRPYDRERRKVLIGKFYDRTLTLDEAVELRDYTQMDVARLEGRGVIDDDLITMHLFHAAVDGFVILLARMKGEAGPVTRSARA